MDECMNFLITGGAGFIGSNMAERLVKEGNSVVAYDNLSSGSIENIKGLIGRRNFKFVKGDLLDKNALDKVFKEGFDAVVHLAANADVRLGIKDTNKDLQNGIVATHNLLEAMRRNDCGQIVFSSSSVVYGNARVKPTPEDYGPLQPISLYGAAKLGAEGLITAYSELFGIGYAIYRFANVVGKRQGHGVVIDFINKLKKNRSELLVLGNGMQRKSYIDVDDCINAMLASYKKSKGMLLNLASDGQTSVRFIAKAVIKNLGLKARIRYTGTVQGWPGDIANTLLSNRKMKSLGISLKYARSNDALLHSIEANRGLFYD